MFHLTTGHIKTSQAEVAEGTSNLQNVNSFTKKLTAVVQCCAQCVGDSR